MSFCGQRLNSLGYIRTIGDYSATRMKQITDTIRWLNLKGTTPSKRSQPPRSHTLWLHIYGSLRKTRLYWWRTVQWGSRGGNQGMVTPKSSSRELRDKATVLYADCGPMYACCMWEPYSPSQMHTCILIWKTNKTTLNQEMIDIFWRDYMSEEVSLNERLGIV
jgi:hypothetical protein